MKSYLNEAVYGAARSGIRRFSALAAETPGCVALTLGEPDFDTAAPVVAAAHTALDSGETHYIQNPGTGELRAAIAAFERERNGLDYTPEEIIVTAGATQAIFTAFFSILNPGDEVIIPTPAYMLYDEAVKLCRGVPVHLPLSGRDFQIDRDALEALITPRTRAIVLNSPNNPTGTILRTESLEAVRSCVEGRPIFVLCDDVYRQLIYTGEYHSFAEYRQLREQILVAQSFSKPYAMTGWRMGYLMAPAELTERMTLVHQYMLTSTPAPFQRAAVAALGCDVSGMLSVYRERRDYVVSRLAAMNLPTVPPEGAFYVFPCIEEFGLSSEEFCTRLIREGGLATSPGSAFGAEGYIRLTFCYSTEELREGLDRLERFVRGLRGE